MRFLATSVTIAPIRNERTGNVIDERAYSRRLVAQSGA